ncbi:MAG TPA: FAD-dependent oxidoreductase [Vicinamibacterales bacterium]|jgi:NADPH-dependent 2,4-dienoyl-CoA reductase/sulfur reductase-like enzyme/nitrite reductase/ring-hydroxylating ferredoxin subunit|nr:FAD-dependent oxidoreductase [Vicinamibacterales bacterium]
MSETANRPTLDLRAGVPLNSITVGDTLLGRVGDDDVVLTRTADGFFAVGAACTHYKGPLAEGLVVGDTIRCPLHHSCFSLRTGEALTAPAFDPIACWKVEQRGDTLFVGDKLPAASRPEPITDRHPSSVVIVGGGAAGFAAAEMLRREGYGGAISIVSGDADAPVDRPNLSKDYLSGEAPEDWLPLWSLEQYRDRHIDLQLGSRAASIDPSARTLRLENGSEIGYGALLIATGAEPVRLPIPGATDDRVFYLRTLADSRRIIERTQGAKRVVVAGASFIGLEVAASLRTRGVAVDVVGPEKLPLEKVMGPELGRFIHSLHLAHGVVFHLTQTIAAISGRTVTLSGGGTLDADFVVIGVGVRPAIALAEKAGLAIDRGILVNDLLETTAPHIFAAGDVARYPDPRSGERIRVEHWVVAERQGQVAARNMLGHRVRFDAVPFFWSQHYDVTIRYVGHAEQWDAIVVDGDLEQRDAAVSFTRAGTTLAVATVSRDRASLSAELAMEARDPAR